MILSKEKLYSVKAFKKDGTVIDYGAGYTGTEVRQIIGSAKYDFAFDMFFNRNSTIGYSIKEM